MVSVQRIVFVLFAALTALFMTGCGDECKDGKVCCTKCETETTDDIEEDIVEAGNECKPANKWQAANKCANDTFCYVPALFTAAGTCKKIPGTACDPSKSTDKSLITGKTQCVGANTEGKVYAVDNEGFCLTDNDCEIIKHTCNTDQYKCNGPKAT